jgi:hypothetical protein
MKKEEMIDKAKHKISQHYAGNQKQPGHMEPDAIIERLRSEYESEDELSMLGLRELSGFPMPEPLARDIILSWREPDREKVTVIVDTSADAEAARLSPHELVDKYNPDLQPDAYGKRLAEIAISYANSPANAPKFLIFQDESLNKELSLDKKLTKKELDHLKGVGKDRDIAIYEGVSHETFAIGSRPVEYTDQSPWNPDESLYKDESNAGVAWKKLPLKARQLVYIVSATVNKQAFKYPQQDKDAQVFRTYREQELFDDLHSAHERARAKAREDNLAENEARDYCEKSGFQAAVRIFPYAAAFFKDLERQRQLPSMKAPVGGSSSKPAAAATTGSTGSQPVTGATA